jgi:hypothetical protein
MTTPHQRTPFFEYIENPHVKKKNECEHPNQSMEKQLKEFYTIKI